MAFTLKNIAPNHPNAKNQIDYFFLKACRNGNLKGISEIFSNQKYLEKIDNNFLSIGLELACINGNAKIAKLILELPFFEYIPTKKHPLVSAAKNNREKVIKLLLMHPKGKDIFSIHDKDKKNKTFIDEVVKSKNALKIITFLHSNKKLKENLQLDNGSLTLNVCMVGNLELFKFVYNDDYFVKTLIQQKESIANKIFSLVLQSGNQDFIRYLISHTKIKDHITFNPSRYDIMATIIRNMELETLKILDSSLNFIDKRVKAEKDDIPYTSLLSFALRSDDNSITKYILSHSHYKHIEENKLSALYDVILYNKPHNLSYVLMDKHFLEKYNRKEFLDDFLSDKMPKYCSASVMSGFLFSLEKQNYKNLYIFKEAFEQENISDWQNRFLKIIIKNRHQRVFDYFLNNVSFNVSQEIIDSLSNIPDSRLKEFEKNAYHTLKAKMLHDKLQYQCKDSSIKNTKKNKI